MDHRRYRSFIGLVVAWCAVLCGSGDPLYSASAGTADPFAALHITRMTSAASVTAFNLKGLDGETLSSQDLAGKAVLMNFWATWCGPCKEEIPSLARLQTQFDPLKVRIVTVTTDVYPQGIRQFLDHMGVRLPVLFDEDQELSRAFMVRGLPTTVVISPQGQAVGRAVGPRPWDSQESIALIRQVLEGTK